MFKLPEQRLHRLIVPHENTWIGAFKWWFGRQNKDCKRFCPICQYYFRCQEDIEIEKKAQKKSQKKAQKKIQKEI